MPVIDTDLILAPVSADQPTGDPLDNDPAFLALETLSQGTPERVMGDVVVPAEEPNWTQLQDQALRLLERSKDLRVVILLLRALLHKEAIQGLSLGLGLLSGLVERYWDGLYPLPDEDDPTDQMERAMAFSALTDHAALLSPLERIPLVSARGFGCPSLRDLRAIQTGAPPADTKEPLDAAAIAAAFEHCELDQLRANTEAAGAALEHGRQLAGLLAIQLPPAIAPDLSPLLSLLASIEASLRAHLEEREPSERQPADRADADVSAIPDLASGYQASVNQTGAPPAIGTMTSRADVQRTLDALCQYYAEYEPSSPIPLLLRRARRLVTMGFEDIVQDLIPESIDKVKALKGPEDETG